MSNTLGLLKKIDLPSSGHYVIAVSGGVDSVVLLHLLAMHWLPDAKPGAERRLHVAHLDHGLRPDAEVDRRLVADLAHIYGLPFSFHEAKLGKASEETARIARYDFLRLVASRHHAGAIITAHHLDDRQETSVFNLLRGSGRVGLAPMSQVPIESSPTAAQRLPVLRPLLKVTKSELIAYANHYGLPWHEDSSNTDLAYTRNFIRHELLPSARRAQPDFDAFYHRALTRLDQLNLQIDNRLSQLIRTGHSSRDSLTLQRDRLAAFSQKPLEHLVARVMRQLQPDLQLSNQSLQRLAATIKGGGVANRQPLSGQLWLRLTATEVTFGLGPAITEPKLQPQDFHPGTSLRSGRFQLSRGYLGRHLSRATLIRPVRLMVRTVNVGDRIAPLGLNGTKKVGDLFTDAKVPRAERLSYPIVASYNDEVVWVPGLALSRYFASPATAPSADCLTYQLLN